MSKTPILDMLEQSKGTIRFHTPAHNGQLPKFVLENGGNDITELTYSDNLLTSSGAILCCEEKIAKIYGAENCLMFTTGATSAIFTAVFATKQRGNFLVFPNCHKSVFNALRVQKTKAFVLKSFENDITFWENILLSKDIRTIILTSPNYYGDVVDMEELSEVCNSHDIKIIVDASHGGHFPYSKLLPKNPMAYADIAVFSLHKTMPVLTGGAILCCKSQYFKRALLGRAELTTTSPNYLTMASIDYATAEFLENGEKLYQSIFAALEKFKHDITATCFSVLPKNDFTRLIFVSPYRCEKIVEFLESKKIYLEMAEGNKLVAIVTPYNFQHLYYLANVLKEIDVECLEIFHENKIKCEHSDCIELNFSDAYNWINLKDAIGYHSYHEVGLYPPSTPIIYSGELIKMEHIEILKDNQHRTFGLIDNKILVLTESDFLKKN